MADPTPHVVARIGWCGQLSGPRARGGPLERGRCPVVQGVMGALVVVRTAAAVDACWWCRLVVRRWPGGFSLEGAVPALVCPVLLWAPRFKALRAAAKRDPPHGELAQAAEGRGGEWRAVVRAHRVGQAIVREQGREDGAGLHLLGREPRRATSEKAAVGVGHRQGGAGEASARAERALAVRRPDGVRGLGLHGDGPWLSVPPAACARLPSAGALAPRAHGARRRPGQVRPTACEVRQHLARTPVPVSPFGFQEDRCHRL